MGKPFESELDQLAKTYRWSLRTDVSQLAYVLANLESRSLLVVGSGGSLSTASLAADLWTGASGGLASFTTPYIAAQAIGAGFRGNVLLISAGGENSDIVGFARRCISCETRSVVSLCCRPNSTLSATVAKYGHGSAFEFLVPSGPDGFLATNTLLTLNTILMCAFGRRKELDRSWKRFRIATLLAQAFQSSLPGEIVLLYGPHTRSAALDLESKFSEAALAAVQAVDLRNFAHGRHHWLAKRPNTGVIALASSSDAEVMRRTIAAFPSSVRSLPLVSERDGVAATFEMQSAVFELTLAFGKFRQIDPGRPGIPDFGRRIYHLNGFNNKRLRMSDAAIERKIASRENAGFDRLPAIEYKKQYQTVVLQFRAARFKQVVFDYDGTLCDHRDRLGGIRPEIAVEMNRLLDSGIPIGVATGRGKSVGKALREHIASRHWGQIIVGYYNSSICLPLAVDEEICSFAEELTELRRAYDYLRKTDLPKVKFTLRPTQLTIESDHSHFNPDIVWRLVREELYRANICGLKIVTSSRSIDILSCATSKLCLMQYMPKAHGAKQTLFIGDRPRWPGNDCEILDQEFALSVDEVSPHMVKGWNLAPRGVLNADAALYYLRACRVSKDAFRLSIANE